MAKPQEFESIKYRIKKNKQAKCLRIAVHRDAEVVLTIPSRASLRSARSFIREKAAWIKARQAEARRSSLYVSSRDSRNDYLKNKEKARILAVDRLLHFNRTYGFKFKRIAIRCQKTRWGSCSRQGNLNFNYKIIRLPAHLADYVIVHELCHLGELNHSPRFWQLVARTLPDHQKCRRELKSLSI